MIGCTSKEPMQTIGCATYEILSGNTSAFFDWDPLSQGRDEDNYHSSISEAFLQVDIMHCGSAKNSLEMIAIEDVNNSELIPVPDPSFAIIKDFFETTMTNGVDSLSQFLLKEFKRILADSLGNQERPAEDGKITKCASESEKIILGDFFTDNSEDFVSEGVCGEQLYEHFGDDFLGHASESEKRTPISSMDDLWDSETNNDICNKAFFITPKNCLPTGNLNTQIKIYRKKYQRSHHMKTRSQTRLEY
ncbi:unnamed protein product [Cuscuta epithymum]|uniref:Uncharacterized protein n=1 Tax=Cuscuta epithymum TaxID=186058 RepID=A0AAV0FHP9_9ASTE|nr:unnamed protein product [Cuscuta epithymum]